MIFSSGVFLLAFLPFLLVCYFLANRLFCNIKVNNTILLIASLVFYAWGEPVFIFIMVFFVFLNYIAGLLIDKNLERHKMKMLIAFVMTALNIALLVFFKYISFILWNVKKISGLDFAIPDIALPIGISFFTFQMMSYIFDVASCKAKAQKSFFDLLLYISMFPQLIAGPIVRYETIAQELKERSTSFDDFCEGFERFLKGLSKKILLANNIAFLADGIFAYPKGEMSMGVAWLGAAAYGLQIYFDFSGYSDMAIGLGRMFGFHFLENFDSPYKSKSMIEFWKRWHISMATWFRDYVYFPMGGSRVKTRARRVFNSATVWFLTGLWHGANWTYILWGIMQWVVIVMEKVLHIAKVSSTKLHNFFLHLWALFWILICMVLFRSTTVTSALYHIRSMFDFPSLFAMDKNFAGLMSQFWVFILVGSVICLFDMQKITKRMPKTLHKMLKVALYIVFFFLCLCSIAKGGKDPFIYFNF